MQSNPVVVADSTGVILFWSAGAEKAFGHTAAAAVGRTLDLIVPAEYREAHWNGFRRAIASGAASLEGRLTPFPVQQADGVVTAVPGTLTLIRRAQGQVIAAMVVFESED
jgi:PAS domain S-box-containing protein